MNSVYKFGLKIISLWIRNKKIYINRDCTGGIHCRGIAICWYRWSKTFSTTNLTTALGAATRWPNSKDTDWNQDGIESLVQPYKKCLDFGWDWEGNYCDSSTIKCEMFLWELDKKYSALQLLSLPEKK